MNTANLPATKRRSIVPRFTAKAPSLFFAEKLVESLKRGIILMSHFRHIYVCALIPIQVKNIAFQGEKVGYVLYAPKGLFMFFAWIGIKSAQST
jgi:hypothetical protein